MKRIALGMAMISLISVTGCMAPKSFVKTMEPSWASVELRTGMDYETAWAAVVDTLVKRFDLEVLSKENGYIRTTWLYTWTGRVMENYRVRVTVKFSPDKTKCEIKSEAEYGGSGRWAMGYDSRLLATIKTDVMGTIGRTTR